MRRAAALFISIALALPAALTDAPPAVAAEDFTFHGSGYGHGLGMGQYGMLGLARAGWLPAKILRHYYTGTKVKKKPPPEKRIRVGLVQDDTEVKLRSVDGPYVFQLQNGKVIETVPDGKNRWVRVKDGKYKIEKPSGALVGGKLWGGKKTDLYAIPQDSRIWVADWGHHVMRGKVAFNIIDDNHLDVVADVPVQQYVFGVSEVPNTWHKMALRTQAIASRTFAYWRLLGPRTGCSCDILSTTADQFYTGADKETAFKGNRWVSAARKTKKKVVLHKGTPIYSVYGSSSGGHTEAIQNVWPAAAASPYLKGVCDPKDDVPENPNTTWKATFTASAVTDALKPYTGGIGTVESFKKYDRGVSGRVTTVKVVGSSGSKVVGGWNIRTALGLKDTRFYVNKNLNITGQIRQKYDAIDCKPGKSMSKKVEVDGGRYQRFKKGRIYVNDGPGKVVWVRGKVLDTYLGEGGHNSGLGLPKKYLKIDGGTKGVFDGGKIVCTGGCTVTYD
ncbi:MAG: SpoIID/LytB domain-containing protein [Actinomycetota bacterium]